MTDSSRAEAALPKGNRISPGADGASADLRRPQPSWGWGVVAAAVVWCAGWDFVLLASAGIGARMNWCRTTDVTTVQVIHGMWNTGSGAKETVWLVGPFQRGFDLHKEEHQSAAVPTEILALATAVARHVAAPMRVVEMVIPEPSSD